MNKINFCVILVFMLLSFTGCKHSVKNQHSSDTKNLENMRIHANTPAAEIGTNDSSRQNHCLIFEQLTRVERDSFVNANKTFINKQVLLYYDKYSVIKNLNTISSLVVGCKTDDVRLVPFYFYVVNQLSLNSDGYVGEEINDYYYDSFIKFPQYIYPYLFYLKNKKYDDYKGLLYNILFDINGEEYSDTYLDSIFKRHKELYPYLTPEIDSVSRFILNNKD